ncbi:PL29 family lyase N-terminal domain-containing protein [Bacteroides caecimuris]|uniref:PL29 family lyase N-terminal domain-containing protein n=1 Tax=Bacteroides caecimuris TaxID=1796613 RepID=UPI001C3D06B7|nr:PL29 family lyase N-terminal domain-containing protein [Bacteroides caecimuris]
MKRKFVKVMFFGALALSTVTYVGCKDYDDDIDNLQTQIDAVKVSLEELQTKVNSGSVITNVVKEENGITVTLSDGKSYVLTNGKDGADGKNGADADVWTIGEKDGYWYKNGVKTEYKAVGVDGAPGADGSAGEEGVAGENGKYYVPNKETGCFDIYQDGKLLEATEISWKTAASEGGITAVLNGNVLTLQGVEGAPEGVAIDITSGIALSSIAFIPDVVSTDVPYATTSKPFYHIESYLDEAKFNASGKFNAQKDWGKSNVVALNYRLNPEDANIDGKTVFGFIDRKVKTRAAGDKKVLLNVDETKVSEGVVTIETTINPNALAQNAEYNIAALQAWYGQKPMTSDYVHATSSKIDLVLADSMKTKEGDNAAITFYKREKSIKNGESDAFIKQFVALNAAVNATFKYDATIDLKDYVGLYSNDKDNWLAALGFKGMSYEFLIPEKYLAEDDEKTNQQWFIVKEGENIASNGVIKVNPEVKNGTPAIGRTPVVRVDAFLTSNAGEKKLVASSYIKLEITETSQAPDEQPDYGIIDMSADKEADYHKLEDGVEAFTNDYDRDNVSMDYQAINNKIYGTAKLTSTTFWNYYGGVDHKYNVLVTVTGRNDQEQTIIDQEAEQSTDVVINDPSGILLNIKLNDDATKTSAIKVGINNLIKTQNYYKNVDGKGAKYSVKITIPSNDTSHGDIVLQQVFYVKEECVAYTYNPLYYNETYQSLADGRTYEDCIVVKGQENSGWEMSSVVSEHFENNEAGEDIFTYYNTVNNVSALQFQWASGVTGVSPQDPFSTDQTVKLTEPMTERDAVKKMTYQVTLKNGEKCNFAYNIVFINPFVATNATGIKIFGNGIGVNTGATMPEVLVKDNEGSAIYSYSSTALALSDKAINTYKLSADMVSVRYAFVEEGDWAILDRNMSANSELNVDATTGVVTWKNEGSTLTRDYNLTVIATVTFKDLSVVKCEIPVTLTKEAIR